MSNPGEAELVRFALECAAPQREEAVLALVETGSNEVVKVCGRLFRDDEGLAGRLLARLTGQPVEPTALGRTLADRTAIVPTIVALGWDVEALPSRPDGRARAVPDGYGPEPAERVEAAVWYAGAAGYRP